MALIIATHDPAIAAELASEIVVLEAGRVIDRGDAVDVLPRHGRSAPSIGPVPVAVDGDAPTPAARDAAPSSSPPARSSKALLRVDNLAKFFPVRHGLFGRLRFVRAVDGVHLYVRRGETLAVVGESGSGKTTLARAILRLTEPTYGRVVVEGQDVVRMRSRELQAARRTMQLIPQDPSAALDPAMTVLDAIAEGIRIFRLAAGPDETRARVLDWLGRLGLHADLLGRRTRTLSASERRLVSIGRALAVQPSFVIGDDPVSALDAETQARVLSVLRNLQTENRTAFLLVTRDLSVAQNTSHRVAVMYLGRIVELAKTADLFDGYRHPYTQALLSAAPALAADRKRLRVVLEGDPPSAFEPPSGCAFHPRCPRAQKGKCDLQAPPLEPVAGETGHRVACFFPDAAWATKRTTSAFAFAFLKATKWPSSSAAGAYSRTPPVNCPVARLLETGGGVSVRRPILSGVVTDESCVTSHTFAASAYVACVTGVLYVSRWPYTWNTWCETCPGSGLMVIAAAKLSGSTGSKNVCNRLKTGLSSLPSTILGLPGSGSCRMYGIAAAMLVGLVLVSRLSIRLAPSPESTTAFTPATGAPASEAVGGPGANGMPIPPSVAPCEWPQNEIALGSNLIAAPVGDALAATFTAPAIRTSES
jgi:peptide/nickel transport system ATP-binding protein